MRIIKYAVQTEKSIRLIESENKIVFVVDNSATKTDIRAAVESMFSAKVKKVNVLNGPNGKKKAYVKFSDETPAIEIATNLGMM